MVSEGYADLNLASDCDAVDERLAEIFHQVADGLILGRKTVSNARMLHGGAIKISHRLRVSSVLLQRAETKLGGCPTPACSHDRHGTRNTTRRRARQSEWASARLQEKFPRVMKSFSNMMALSK